MSTDRRLRRLQRASRNGGGYPASLELGRRFADVLDGRRAADARQLSAALARCSAEVASGPAAGEFGAANLAFLVPRNRLAAFDAAVDELTAVQRDRLTIRVLGPMAPYSFVGSVLSGAA